MKVLACLVLLLATAFAGCIDGDAPTAGDDALTFATPKDEVMALLASVPVPTFSPASAVDTWEAFLGENPYRHWATPHNAGATEFLLAELEAAGFESEILTVQGQAYVVPDQEFKVVRGILWGADTTQRVALIAHYDTVPQTAQGAYDDAAGTIAELEICKLLAQAKAQLQRTIECLFFDGEETGLSASRAWIRDYEANPDRGYDYAMGFGYDMTGINWPGHEWKLYAMSGTDNDQLAELNTPHQEFLGLVLHDYLDGAQVLPGATEGIEVLEVHDRNSDEQSFKAVGIPVVRFAGGRKAADYPGYHQPFDTVPYVYQFVGGRPNFEAGYNAVILSSYYTILAFDAYGPYGVPTA